MPVGEFLGYVESEMDKVQRILNEVSSVRKPFFNIRAVGAGIL